MTEEQPSPESRSKVANAAAGLGRFAMSGLAAIEYGAGFILTAGGASFMILEGVAGQFSESVAEIGAVAVLSGCVLMGHAESWM